MASLSSSSLSPSSRSRSSAAAQAAARGRANSLPVDVVDYLKAWLDNHLNHPYPTEQEKENLMADTGIELKRLNNWFVNNRIRYWKPRVEALMKEREEQKIPGSPADAPKTMTDVVPSEDEVPPSKDDTPARGASKSTVLPPRSSFKKFQDLSSPRRVSDASTGSTIEPDVAGHVSPSTVVSTSSSCSSSPDEEHEHVTVVWVSPPRMTRFNNNKRPRDDDHDDLEDHQLQYLLSSPPSQSRFRRPSVEDWRAACLTPPDQWTTAHALDANTSLPSFDDAACLFGYTKS